MANTLGYWNTIQSAAGQYDLDPRLVAGVIRTESSGNPNAYSSAGAMGLMQLMPTTAKSLGVTDPYNPTQNIYGGAALLRENIDRYGDVETALLAYHGGTNKRNWGEKTRAYPAKVFNNIKNLFGSSQVLPSVKGVAGAENIEQPKISNYTAPDLSGLVPDVSPMEISLTPAQRRLQSTVDRHNYQESRIAELGVGGALKKTLIDAPIAAVKDFAMKPVEAAGNYALRGVVILAAVVIVGLGLYFMFKDQIADLAIKALPVGKTVKTVKNAIGTK